jgi:hypothetical protein
VSRPDAAGFGGDARPAARLALFTREVLTEMAARSKLNRFYVYSCIGLASLAGLLSGSWMIFFVVLALTIAGSVHGGEIRVRPSSIWCDSRGRGRR